MATQVTALLGIAPSSDAGQVFFQYGALGAITVVLLVVARVMFMRLQENFDKERERADRLEAELRKLNETIRTEYLTTISLATRAIADALAAVQRRNQLCQIPLSMSLLKSPVSCASVW